jgi:hypothetical protein
MPGAAPTEILADDVKDLRASNREIAGELKGVLTGQARMETELKFIRWIGGFMASTMFVLVGSAITISWNASSLVSEIRSQGSRLDKIERNNSQIPKLAESIAVVERAFRQDVPVTKEVRPIPYPGPPASNNPTPRPDHGPGLPSYVPPAPPESPAESDSSLRPLPVEKPSGGEVPPTLEAKPPKGQ